MHMAERIFPLDSGETAWSSTLQQAWEVTQTETASGRRRAICSQLYPKLSFTVSFTALDDKNLSLLIGFYAKCKGTLLPFFYKDYGARVELQELSRDESGKYQLFIKNGGYVLPCEKADNVSVYIDDKETADFTLDGDILTVPAATAKSVVMASFDYYWRVRFSDTLSVTQTFADVNNVNLKLVTVR
jgi:hypothetical protein